MKRIVILVILMVINVNIFSQENWVTYSNEEAGFNLKYPENIELTEVNAKYLVVDYRDSNTKINLQIAFIKIDKLEPAPIGYDKKSAIEEKKALAAGKVGFGIDWALKVNLIKIGNIFGETFLVLNRGDGSVEFERKLLFFHNNYRIIITLNATNLCKELGESLPDYIKKENNCTGDYCYEWLNIDKFIMAIETGKGNKIIQEWYMMFDKIIDTIEIIDNKYYMTTVSNLRFRKNPTLKSEIIRILNYNEKLLFLDQTNKIEKINNVTGYWIKCKTEKGEIGWCFGAYLNELK